MNAKIKTFPTMREAEAFANKLLKKHPGLDHVIDYCGCLKRYTVTWVEDGLTIVENKERGHVYAVFLCGTTENWYPIKTPHDLAIVVSGALRQRLDCDSVEYREMTAEEIESIYG